MSERQQTSAALPLFAVALLLLGLALAYVVGYYHLSGSISDGSQRWRTFPAHWLVTIYRPAAYVESVTTGEEVHIGYWNP